MSKRRCLDCQYFDPDDETGGECRRYAPRPGDGGSEANWPIVYNDGWCGQFVPNDLKETVSVLAGKPAPTRLVGDRGPEWFDPLASA